MTVEELDRIAQIASMAAVYVPEDCEGIRIEAVDQEEQIFYGTGEETGESYQIEFDEVDIQHDMFYALELINTESGA